MKISCHCLVKNEENFIWYALNSVIDHVDEILIWDTGSSDKTVEIIKTFNSPKIKFQEIGEVTPQQLAKARQKMISESKGDWIFLLDGDEIWFEESIKAVTTKLTTLKNEKLVVGPNIMLIGDMYHYLEEKAGYYKIYDKLGHYSIRFIKNFPGLNVGGSYPDEYYANTEDTPVQNFPKEEIYFDDNTYIHASFLSRSSKDRKKLKHEIGVPLPLDYFYPEAFFRDKPEIVPLPWKTADQEYLLKASFQTPFKWLKRRII